MIRVGPIVVGVDGSDLSIAALRWAVDEAKLAGAHVIAVSAYTVPASIYLVPTYDEGDYERDAQAVLDASVSKALLDDGVDVEKRLVQGRPARALTDAAHDAQLLVIGSHGRGEFPGMHLGSVASYCVHHAPCPVVVYRGPATGP